MGDEVVADPFILRTAEGNRQGVCCVVVFGFERDSKNPVDHFLYLFLRSRPESGQALFHFLWGKAAKGNAGRGGSEEDYPARLAHDHGGFDVPGEKKLLDRDKVGLHFPAQFLYFLR
jgi:hypothetical protein